jgi:hypothetical protein
MIRRSGPVCDVCDRHIIFDKSINPFTIPGIEGTLCCHDACKTYIEEMAVKQDWRILPEGALRRCFEENEDKILVPDGNAKKQEVEK